MRFALDVGHGMNSRRQGVYDPGACANGHEEHKMVEGMAGRLALDLRDLGHSVMVIHDRPLSTRAALAREWGADFLLSLHMNAATPRATGTEVWVNPGASARARKVAGQIAARISNALGIRNRGVKTAWFAILRFRRPDALVEIAFITNKMDVYRYQHRVDSLELAILNGLLVGCGLKSVGKLPRRSH